MEWGVGTTSQGTRSITSMPALESARVLSGLFESSRTRLKPSSWRIAAGSRKSERKIGIHCIEPGVLQSVGLQFRFHANAAAFLIFVDQKSPAFLGDGLH